MGYYLNPSIEGFKIYTSNNYVDKTGLIDTINRTKLKSGKRLMLVSRPRRFGKSLAAMMLSAYYGSGHDSRALFEEKRIAKLDPNLTNMNAFHVLYLDIAALWGYARSWQEKQNRKK